MHLHEPVSGTRERIRTLHVRRPRFEQQPAGARRAPADLIETLRPEVVSGRRLGRGELAAAPHDQCLGVGEDVHLVLVRHLPRQPDRLAPEPLLTIRRIPGRIERRPDRGVEEHARDLNLRASEAARSKEPQLVFPDGAADGRVEVVELADVIGRRQPAAAQLVGQVVALQRVVRIEAEDVQLERVATLLRDHVDQHAAGRALGRDAAGLNRRLLYRRRVEDVARGAGVHVQGVHAVVQELDAALAVERVPVRRVGRVDAGRAAHVGSADESGNDADERRQRSRARRQRRQELVGNHRLLPDVLYVDQRARSRHGHRLFERSNRQVRVHRCGEPCRQLNPFPSDGVEATETEGHRIRARSKVDDVVAPLAVCGHGADLLDENRTGGFHRHTREYPARRVPDQSGNAACLLRPRTWHQHDQRQETGPYDPRP